MAVCFILNVSGALVSDPTPAATCQGFVLLDSVDYANWLTGLTNWSYDTDLMLLGFKGSVLCWTAGLAVGLVISIVRKMRTH